MALKENRLSRLLHETAPGVPLSTEDLRDRFNVSAQLALHYVKRGWLERIASGVYSLPNVPITLNGTLSFLQKNHSELHVAGKTALAWHGICHNVYFRETTVVWGKSKAGLPKWAGETFQVRYSAPQIFKFPNSQLDLLTRQPVPFLPHSVSCSCIERAILEMLSEVGTKESWEEARNIFELVSSVRETVIGQLLKSCSSLKAKRLFATWATETDLVNVPELFHDFSVSVGTGKQWLVTVSQGKKTTIRKVLPQTTNHFKTTNKPLHPALRRVESTGLSSNLHLPQTCHTSHKDS